MNGNTDFSSLAKQVDELLDSGRLKEVKQLLQGLKNEDIAEILNLLDEKHKTEIIKLLEIEDAAEVLSEVDESSEQAIVEHIDKMLLSDIIEAMEKDDAADLIQNLDEDTAKKIFELIDSGESEKIKQLLKYPEDSAGGIMTTDFITLRPDMTVDEAIEVFRRTEPKTKVFHAYVVDNLNRLVGVVSLRKLITSPGNAKIGEIMYTDVIKVRTTDDQEKVARIVSKYNLLAVPVVDAFNRLVGIVTVDDVIDVIHQEATEDMYKMVGTSYEESESKSVLAAARFRAPWLIVSLVGEMLSGWILKNYNHTLGQVLVLASFIPVIMAMGGNVGTQAATVVVRGIATGRIAGYKVFHFILHEIGTGALIGLLSGILVGLVSMFWQFNPYLAVSIAISMFIGMTLAATVGSLLPLLFNKLGIDPAVATGPFVTTFNDVVGLFIYMVTATLLINYLI